MGADGAERRGAKGVAKSEKSTKKVDRVTMVFVAVA